jgi:hypothetical protein
MHVQLVENNQNTGGEAICVIVNFQKILSSLFWDVKMRRLAVADVSGYHVGPTLTLENGADRLSRNVVHYQSTLRNIPVERRSHVHGGGSPKSRLQNTWFIGNFMFSPHTRRSHTYVQCLSPSDLKLEKVSARPCFYPILHKNIIPKAYYLPKRFKAALAQVTTVFAERQYSVLL